MLKNVKRILVWVVPASVLVACPSDLKMALREYGYTPVRPASALWRPGSLVWIKQRNPLMVGFVCTASQVMGTDYAALRSPTTNADLARASKKGITLGAKLQDIASADGDFSDVKNVTMRVRNVQEYVVTDLDVSQAAVNMNRRCLEAVKRRRAQGYDVTLISGSIEADVSFQVGFKRSSKLDAQAKIATAQNISAKLGVDASSITDKSIEATSLVWGVRADEFLARVLAPELPPADRGSRIFDPATVGDIEAFAAGTEPRSMPTTPMTEQTPMVWAPLPVPPVAQATVVDPAELAAAVSGSPAGVTAQPPQPAAIPVDVPTDPEVSPPEPNAGPTVDPAQPAVEDMTDEEWADYLQNQGFDPDATFSWPELAGADAH